MSHNKGAIYKFTLSLRLLLHSCSQAVSLCICKYSHVFWTQTAPCLAARMLRLVAWVVQSLAMHHRRGAVVQLVEYRTHNQEVAGSTHTRSTASNLKQVANLLCAQANSASYPQQNRKWVRLRGEGLVWLIGAMVCLLVQLSVNTGNGWPHNALWHQWLMPISCHFRDCKALLVTSLTHASGAIASVQTFTFHRWLLASKTASRCPAEPLCAIYWFCACDCGTELFLHFSFTTELPRIATC